MTDVARSALPEWDLDAVTACARDAIARVERTPASCNTVRYAVAKQRLDSQARSEHLDARPARRGSRSRGAAFDVGESPAATRVSRLLSRHWPKRSGRPSVPMTAQRRWGNAGFAWGSGRASPGGSLRA